jgi:hypothetical protein
MSELFNYYTSEKNECFSPINLAGVVSLVVLSCALGIGWAIRNVLKVTSINLS